MKRQLVLSVQPDKLEVPIATNTTPTMPQSERGPERRHGSSTLESSTMQSPAPETERRVIPDRRRNAYVSRIELCRGLSYAQVEDILERCPVQHLAVGEALLEPGVANHHLYFLLSGQLEVRLQLIDSPSVDTIAVGECIGEMSIIDGLPTSAFVVATEPSSVISIHGNIFWSKIAIFPTVVRNLSRVLAERMRKRNDATLRAVEKELRLEQLQKELSAAYEIQTGMLPPGPRLLEDLPDLDVFVRMDVVKSVGGDFYDSFMLDERRVCIAIGDVSGKGMPAALFMVRTLTLLRSELVKPSSLASCLNRFNRVLCDTNISHMFVTLLVVWIDLVDGTIEYVNAGHPPMLVSRGGSSFVAIDESKGLIAGVLADSEYSSETLLIKQSDRVVLYTDGVTEARDTHGKFYGQQRLVNNLSRESQESSTNLVAEVFNDLVEFLGPAGHQDDITVLAISMGRGER
ncbi:MAG: sigma-B regulation protein RsbU (phosphoserine phosphatase) [Gammaproteobacteria bacterium]